MNKQQEERQIEERYTCANCSRKTLDIAYGYCPECLEYLKGEENE